MKQKIKIIKGFTLIEILIVLSIILILFSLSTQIFKPIENLKKIRDQKRISDLTALNIALKAYLSTTSSPNLGPTNTGIDEINSTIFISIPFDKEDKRNDTINWNSKTYYFSQASSTFLIKNNGQGWLKVDFSILPYQPIFALPYDPINSFDQKLFYSFVFKRSNNKFEINANLESQTYKFQGNEDKASIDNGDNNNVLEIGTDKTLMPNNLY